MDVDTDLWMSRSFDYFHYLFNSPTSSDANVVRCKEGNLVRELMRVLLKAFLAISLVLAVCVTKADELNASNGWFVDERNGKEVRLLHPSCFVTEWMSSDNFEEYEEVFNIQREDFRLFPGVFFGREITNYHPIKPSWNKNRFISHETISLIQSVEACAPESFEYSVADDESIHTNVKTDFGKFEQKYRVLDSIDVKECSGLAPNISSACLQAFRVRIGEYSGGSMGWDFRQGIYGLFDIEGMGLSVVPLKYYPTN